MKPQTTPTLKLDLRIIIIILIVVILGMLAMWRPWEATHPDRIVTTTGQAEVSAEPDEFTFTPYFERKGSDTAKSKAELETYGKKLLEDLTKLGVTKENITMNVNAYDIGLRPTGAEPNSNESSVNLTTTIKVTSKDMAQKVQDYLSKTDAKGQVTSQPGFSQAKRSELENQARDKAIKDAKSKAERTASNLNAKLGKVKQVKESQNQGIAYPAIAEDLKQSIGTTGLPVTPGNQPVTASVEVIFELQ